MAKATTLRDLRAIRISLRQLQQSFDRLSKVIDRTTATKAPRKLRLTPARRAALKLQGQYMGHMRGLKPRQKVEVKNIKAAKGIRAAIAAAKRLGS